MLQIDKARPAVEQATIAADVASPEELYNAFMAFVRRQFPTIIFVWLLILGLAFSTTLLHRSDTRPKRFCSSTPTNSIRFSSRISSANARRYRHDRQPSRNSQVGEYRAGGD